MSLINAAAPYRRDDRQDVRVPVVMPLVEVDVDKDGYLTVMLDHEPYSADRALTRNDLKRVLDEIAADLGTAVRVEVREADMSAFTDIVTPECPKLAAVKPMREATTTIGEVAGRGFLAGEEVAVAVVVAHQIAIHTPMAATMIASRGKPSGANPKPMMSAATGPRKRPIR